MGERQAVTRKLATEYRRASKARKGEILDQVCALTGWHRSHARKALAVALKPRVVRPRAPRPPIYSEAVVEALRFCWAVQGAPCGRLLKAALPDIVPRLRRLDTLDIEDQTAELLVAMSAATIDRRLAGDRAKLDPRGRSHTKPGTLLKASIPIWTWAEWDDATPGFVEIDLVGHEGGNACGDYCFTLTVTDIATGWTETQSVKNKAQKWVFEALLAIRARLPFPLLGINFDYADLGVMPTLSRVVVRGWGSRVEQVGITPDVGGMLPSPETGEGGGHRDQTDEQGRHSAREGTAGPVRAAVQVVAG